MTNTYASWAGPPPQQDVPLASVLEPHYRPWRCWNGAHTEIIIGAMPMTGAYKQIATTYITNEINDELRDQRDRNVIAWDGRAWVLIR